MSATRTDLVIGPAKCSFRDFFFFSKEESFNVNTSLETFDINTSVGGKEDERAIEVAAEVTITPEGRYTGAMIGALWAPFANMRVGTSLVGYTADVDADGVVTNMVPNSATDEPLVMDTETDKHTIIAAAVTKPPDIILSATKTMVGAATFKGVRGYGLSWETDNSIYNIEAGAPGNTDDTSFNASQIRTQPYTGYFTGITGFGSSATYGDGFETQDGFTFSVNVTTKDIPTDTAGNFDIRLVKVEVMCKCIPIGPTARNILDAQKMQGSGAARGHSLAGVGAEFIVTGADGTEYVTIPNAALKTAGYRFGPSELRNNEIGFVATRTRTVGVMNELFRLGAP